MIIALSLMPASYVLDESIKLPANPLARDMPVVHTTAEVRDHISHMWDSYMGQENPGPAWMQLDIIEGRKVNGLSAAAKSGGLGVNVWVTKNLAKSKNHADKPIISKRG